MKTTLTDREREVLQLIVSEYTTPEIAHKLRLSKETIRTHRRKILTKLQVRNVAGMVRKFFELAKPGWQDNEVMDHWSYHH